MHFLKACVLLASLPVLAWSLTIPSADMPVFYLVSSSTSASANLLVHPIRRYILPYSPPFAASPIGSR